MPWSRPCYALEQAVLCLGAGRAMIGNVGGQDRVLTKTKTLVSCVRPTMALSDHAADPARELARALRLAQAAHACFAVALLVLRARHQDTLPPCGQHVPVLSPWLPPLPRAVEHASRLCAMPCCHHGSLHSSRPGSGDKTGPYPRQDSCVLRLPDRARLRACHAADRARVLVVCAHARFPVAPFFL